MNHQNQADDLWKPPRTAYCDDDGEYARGTPQELANQVKALKEAARKLIAVIDAEKLLRFLIVPSEDFLDPSPPLDAAVEAMRELSK